MSRGVCADPFIVLNELPWDSFATSFPSARTDRWLLYMSLVHKLTQTNLTVVRTSVSSFTLQGHLPICHFMSVIRSGVSWGHLVSHTDQRSLYNDRQTPTHRGISSHNECERLHNCDTFFWIFFWCWNYCLSSHGIYYCSCCNNSKQMTAAAARGTKHSSGAAEDFFQWTLICHMVFIKAPKQNTWGNCTGIWADVWGTLKNQSGV